MGVPTQQCSGEGSFGTPAVDNGVAVLASMMSTAPQMIGADRPPNPGAELLQFARVLPQMSNGVGTPCPNGLRRALSDGFWQP